LEAGCVSAADRLERARESEGLASTRSVVRRRWPLIVGIAIACVLVAVVRHERAGKSYAAVASVAFQATTLPESALQVSSSTSGEPLRDAATEMLVAHSSEVALGVRKQLHISVEPSVLLDEVGVEVAPNANVLHFSATTGDPVVSARLANAFANQYIAFKTTAQDASIDAAQRQLQTQIAALPAGSPSRVALEQSQQRLAGLRAVAGGGANIISQATPPTSPTGTSLKTTAVIGLLIGLAVAFAVVFLIESLDRRIKSIEEFEDAYGLPALAGVPQAAFESSSARGREHTLEPYRILRSALDFAAATRQLDTLLVTSAVSGEGKTTVAVDLAHAIALTGRDTVVVELDLRRPTVVSHFGLSHRDGLTSALVRDMSVDELLVRPFDDLPGLAILPAGRLPPNPSELLGTARVTNILGELVGEGTQVIIDAPPLNPVADAQILLNNQAVNAVLLVARAGRTTREEVRRARAILDQHLVEAVGLVVTGLTDAGRYGYEAYAANAPTAPDLQAEERPPSGTAALRRPTR
jgi:capsular exopolysaccharide synthesis family protein